jgi:polysaccharide biosynthesis protein VpsQ
MKNKRNIYIAVAFFLFIILVSVLAYLQILPTQYKHIPYYDSIGHFMLFGILGFLAHIALDRKHFTIGSIKIPTASTLVACYAIADELLQLLSSVRTFDLWDLFFGVLGIMSFYVIDRMIISRA